MLNKTRRYSLPTLTDILLYSDTHIRSGLSEVHQNLKRIMAFGLRINVDFLVHVTINRTSKKHRSEQRHLCTAFESSMLTAIHCSTTFSIFCEPSIVIEPLLWVFFHHFYVHLLNFIRSKV